MSELNLSQIAATLNRIEAHEKNAQEAAVKNFKHSLMLTAALAGAARLPARDMRTLESLRDRYPLRAARSSGPVLGSPAPGRVAPGHSAASQAKRAATSALPVIKSPPPDQGWRDIGSLPRSRVVEIYTMRGEEGPGRVGRSQKIRPAGRGYPARLRGKLVSTEPWSDVGVIAWKPRAFFDMLPLSTPASRPEGPKKKKHAGAGARGLTSLPAGWLPILQAPRGRNIRLLSATGLEGMGYVRADAQPTAPLDGFPRRIPAQRNDQKSRGNVLAIGWKRLEPTVASSPHVGVEISSQVGEKKPPGRDDIVWSGYLTGDWRSLLNIPHNREIKVKDMYGRVVDGAVVCGESKVRDAYGPSRIKVRFQESYGPREIYAVAWTDSERPQQPQPQQIERRSR